MRTSILILVAMLGASCASDGRLGGQSIQTRPPRETPAAAQLDRDLQTGRRVYELHCARCHGRDGKDDTYPFIATLDGIGKRMTLEEILEATWATGFASPHQFSDEEKRGLAVYVAQL